MASTIATMSAGGAHDVCVRPGAKATIQLVIDPAILQGESFAFHCHELSLNKAATRTGDTLELQLDAHETVFYKQEHNFRVYGAQDGKPSLVAFGRLLIAD